MKWRIWHLTLVENDKNINLTLNLITLSGYLSIKLAINM